jgi:hypothetical protein
VGIAGLLVAMALSVRAVVRRKADLRHLALAVTLPFFLVVMSLITAWNPFLIRFFAVPAVLTAPLLAYLFRSPPVIAAWAVAAALAVTLTLTRDQTKPFTSPYGFGHPWQLTQEEALRTNSRNEFADAVTAYERLVPARACVGAVMAEFDPSYLLYGPHLGRRVDYLPADGDPVSAALRRGLFYVVVNSQQETAAAQAFAAAGWRVEPLGKEWVLATDAHGGGSASCR